MNYNIIFTLKKQIKENKQIINELLEIDQKYCKMNINFDMLQNIPDEYINEKIDVQNQETIIIHYNGNPYITLNLSILAILTKNIIVLDTNNNMLGINKFIIETVNNILVNYKTDKLIYLLEDYNEEKVDKIICIDDINKYNKYLREKNEKTKFYSFNYIDFYSDSDEFEEIEELIYKYAENNKIHIESYSELNIDEAVQMISTGLGENIVLLTKNEETKETFKQNIKNKKLYINKNPFEHMKTILTKEILSI